MNSIFEPVREFRRKIQAGKFPLGASITLSDPAVTEVLSRFVDFLWIDLEHTPIGLESLQSHLIACRATATPSLVRIPSLDVGTMKRVLDTGAGGIIVPQIRSADETALVVEACRYAPAGNRGYGPRRASDYGANPQYLETANQDLFVCVQIENRQAIDEIDAIVRIKGLDSVALGPFDLAASLGHMAHPEHPDVLAAIAHVVRTARDAGLAVGMGGPADFDYALRAFRVGVQWLQSGCDYEYMTRFVASHFQKVSAETKPETPPGSIPQSRY